MIPVRATESPLWAKLDDDVRWRRDQTTMSRGSPLTFIDDDILGGLAELLCRVLFNGEGCPGEQTKDQAAEHKGVTGFPFVLRPGSGLS